MIIMIVIIKMIVIIVMMIIHCSEISVDDSDLIISAKISSSFLHLFLYDDDNDDGGVDELDDDDNDVDESFDVTDNDLNGFILRILVIDSESLL